MNRLRKLHGERITLYGVTLPAEYHAFVTFRCYDSNLPSIFVVEQTSCENCATHTQEYHRKPPVLTVANRRLSLEIVAKVEGKEGELDGLCSLN
jgi:hypothetical protein